MHSISQQYLTLPAPPPGPGAVPSFPYLKTTVVGWVPLALPAAATSLLLLLPVGVMVVPAGNVALGASLLDSLGLGDFFLVADTDTSQNIGCK